MVRGRDAQGQGRVEEQARTIAKKEKLLRAVEELHEFNPMLGHRGCRLGHHLPRDHAHAGAGHLRGRAAGVEEGDRR